MNNLEKMPPIHPGEILQQEFLQEMNISQNQLAQATKMPQSRIQAIIAGRRGISVDTAMRLAAFFGNSPQFWLNCQNGYQLDLAEWTGERQRIFDKVQGYAFAV